LAVSRRTVSAHQSAADKDRAKPKPERQYQAGLGIEEPSKRGAIEVGIAQRPDANGEDKPEKQDSRRDYGRRGERHPLGPQDAQCDRHDGFESDPRYGKCIPTQLRALPVLRPLPGTTNLLRAR
jgi:hypothetical protein